MIKDIYINSVSQIAPGTPEPDYKQFVSPIEARRMGKLMKRTLATSLTALKAAGIEKADAVITGTFLGSLENTEALLNALLLTEDAAMKPTHFMQSTHNTVSSMISIRTGSHGYNATYSHGAISFESAILDALTQLGLGEIENALVGLCDESSPAFTTMYGKKDIELMDIASSMVLSHRSEGALCAIVDFKMTRGEAALAGLPQADLTLEAPTGYCIGAEKIAAGECASVLVINKGHHGDNTSYTLLTRI